MQSEMFFLPIHCIAVKGSESGRRKQMIEQVDTFTIKLNQRMCEATPAPQNNFDLCFDGIWQKYSQNASDRIPLLYKYYHFIFHWYF